MKLQFWFEFASTYSYPAVMRADKAAAARGVEIEWRPFLHRTRRFAAAMCVIMRDPPWVIVPRRGDLSSMSRTSFPNNVGIRPSFSGRSGGYDPDVPGVM